MALPQSRQCATACSSLFKRFPQYGRKQCCTAPWRTPHDLVCWTVLAVCYALHNLELKPQRPLCSASMNSNVISLEQLCIQRFWTYRQASHPSTSGHPLRTSRHPFSGIARDVPWSVHFPVFALKRTITTGFCKLGCAHQPDCLRQTISAHGWRQSSPTSGDMQMLVRLHANLHDLLTQGTCRGDQHCILVFGIVDAFVYVHNHHRPNRDDPGHFED